MPGEWWLSEESAATREWARQQLIDEGGDELTTLLAQLDEVDAWASSAAADGDGKDEL